MGRRDAEINLIGNDRTTRATRSVADGLSHVDRAMAKLGPSATDLERKLAKTQARVRDLGEEFVRTGNKDVFKSLRSERAALANLKAISRELEKVEDAAEEAGQELAKATAKGFSGALQSVTSDWTTTGVIIKGVLVTAAISAAPAIGAAVSSGVLLGVGGGAMAAGIKAAARTAEVSSAWKAVGQTAELQWVKAGSAFEAPLLRASGSVQRALEQLDLAGMIDPVAAEVEPLVDGLLGLVREAMPGVRQMVAASAPLLHQLAGSLPQIGDAIGEFAESLADASAGGHAFLTDTIAGVAGLIEFTGEAIEFLSKWYEIAVKARDANPFTAWMGAGSTGSALARAASEAANGLTDLDQAAEATEEQIRDLSSALTDMLDPLLGADNAAIAAQKALDDLHQSVKDNGKTFDISTQKGRENMEALLAGVDAARQAYQAQLDLGNGIPAATAAYEAQIAALEAELRSLGLNQAQIDVLLGKYRQIPGNVHTTVTADGSNAIQALTAVRDIEQRIQRNITIGVEVEGLGQVQTAARAARSIARNSAMTGRWYAPEVAGGGRTQSAAVPDVYATTTVLIDGKAVRSVARTEVRAETSRQAWRARVGRR